MYMMKNKNGIFLIVGYYLELKVKFVLLTSPNTVLGLIINII